MRVREPVGGRGWLLTDLTCGFWNVVWQATKQDACHATGTGPQRGHSLNHQYGLQLMIEQSPQSAMETDSYPKFHNEAGAPIVRIGWREFKCIGDNAATRSSARLS
jgi:hypothetical protein